MTSHTAVLRPFDGIDALDDFFAAITVLVGDELVPADGRITLAEDRYRHVPVSVRLPNDGPDLADRLSILRDSLHQSGFDSEDVLFVVNLYSGFLKISEYVFKCPFSEFAPEGMDISLTGNGPRPNALLTAHSGCRIEVAAVLDRTYSRQIGRAWRRGTWLARSRFVLSCDVEFSGFSPRPMDQEQKIALGLPSGATRYVSLPSGVDPVVDEVSPDVIELWIDADLLASLSARPKAPVSAALQCQLFCDVFAVVTAAARSRSGFEDLAWRDISGSLLGTLLRGIAGREKADTQQKLDARCNRLLTLLKDDHGRFMAFVEDVAGTSSAFTRALGD